jgi:hypothetical protein
MNLLYLELNLCAINLELQKRIAGYTLEMQSKMKDRSFSF